MPATRRECRRPRCMKQRARPTVVQLADGRVLVAGAFGDSCTPMVAFGYSCQPLSSAELFDPVTGTWSPTAPLPAPRAGASGTLLSDGTVLLVGGSGETDEALRYSPASERWTMVGPSHASTGSTLLALPGDRAIALGSEPEAGFYGSYGGAGARARTNCNSTPQIYTPQHNLWIPAPPLPEVRCRRGRLHSVQRGRRRRLLRRPRRIPERHPSSPIASAGNQRMIR